MKVLVLILSIILTQSLSSNQSRFVDNNDGTITDTKTGLIWLKNANFAGGKVDPSDKSIFLKIETATKRKNWRIPTDSDFLTFLDAFKPQDRIINLKLNGFINLQNQYAVYDSGDINNWLIPNNSRIEEPYPITSAYLWPVCNPEEKSAIEPNTNTLVAVAEKPKTEEVIPQTTVEPKPEKPPVQSNSRFVDNNDGTITDTKTGLIWLKNANFAGGKVVPEKECESLIQKLNNTTKYKKWRMPRKEDFSSILKEVKVNDKISTLKTAGFENIQLTYTLGGADIYSILSDSISIIQGYQATSYFWPVCDPEEKSAIEPNTNTLVAVAEKPKTEEVIPQTTVEPIQEKATVQSNSRFVDNNDGTITDTKTGLIWLKNANFAEKKLSYDNKNFIILEKLTGRKNWRIPTYEEFFQLIKDTEPNNRIRTFEEFGFFNIKSEYGIIHGGDTLHFNFITNRIEPEYYFKPDAYLWPVCDPEEKSAIEPKNTLVAVAEKPKTDEVIPLTTVQPIQDKATVQSNSRFVDNNDGTITDTKTGLIWLKNANFAGGKVDSNKASESLLHKLNNTTKYKKWRMPRKEDFSSILKDVRVNDKISTLKDAGFENIQLTYIVGGINEYSIFSDSVSIIQGSSPSGYLWPVCDPEEKSAIESNNTLVAIADKPKTDEVIPLTKVEPEKEKAPAQTDSNISDNKSIKSDDTLSASVDKPKTEEIITQTPEQNITPDTESNHPKKKILPRNKRFADGKDNTIIDKKTGLVWIKDTSQCGEKTWKEAVKYSKSFCGCGHKDWRLPCRKDFENLFKGRNNLSWEEFLETAGFSNIQPWYWTSTPSADFPKRDSYYANLNYGLISTNKNNKKCYVWLVRGKSK